MTNAVTITDLQKHYGQVHALQGVTFTIKKGDFFGLLGPNGAGKTTTINILTGLTNKTTGTVHLFDKDVVKDYKEARALIGLVPQEFNLDTFEKVYRVLYFNAGYFGIPTHERPDRIKQLLMDLNLWDKKDAQVRELSGGMKRKLMIARALLHKPKILILDEPTAGVDVETRRSMWQYFRKLNKEGVTILLTTHYIEEAEDLCSHIGIINEGKIIALDKKRNLMHVLGGQIAMLHLERPIKAVPKPLQRYKAQLEQAGRRIAIPISKKNSMKDLLQDLAGIRLAVERVETREKTLEEIFIDLTHNDRK